MATAVEMMEMYGRALDNAAYQNIRHFVMQRVKEDSDTYPPVYPGIPYVDFLIGQMHFSQEHDGRFHTRMPGITASIIDEIRDKVETSGAEADDYTALSNIAFVIPHLEPTTTTKGISDNLEILANSWLREDPNTIEGQTGLDIAQALSCLQEDGDSPVFWQEMWGDEKRPHLWTTGFMGIIRVSRRETFREIPKAIQRAEETNWHPDSIAWALYTKYLREGTGQGLKDFADITKGASLQFGPKKPVELVFTNRMLEMVAQDSQARMQTIGQILM